MDNNKKLITSFDNEETFVNSNGYLQYKHHQGKGSQLVHRRVAFKEAYLANSEDYYYDFEEYEVHHKNKDKLDNRPENLELQLPKDHYSKHFDKNHIPIRDKKIDDFVPKIMPASKIKMYNKKLQELYPKEDMISKPRLSLWQKIKRFISEIFGYGYKD